MRSKTGRPDDPYAWWIATVSTIAMIFTFGTPLSYGVFMLSFREEYSLSRVALSTVFSVELFAFFAGAGIVGVFATRFSSRKVITVCGIITVALSPSLYVINSYIGLVLVFCLLGITLGTVFVVLASIVPLWFHEHRGIATGILFAGNGLGLFILPPAWQFLFDNFGVQFGFFVLLLLSAATFLIAGLFCQRPPRVRQATVTKSELVEWISQLLLTRQFYFLFIGVSFAFAWYYLLAAYMVELLLTRGLTERAASVGFGFIGGVSILSRLGSGLIADQIGYRRSFFFSLLCAILGCLLLFFPYLPALVLTVFFFGVGLGGVATLYIPILLQIYDPGKDTAIVGVFNIGLGIFALIVPPVGAGLITYTGTYFSMISLTLFILLGAILFLRRGTHDR